MEQAVEHLPVPWPAAAAARTQESMPRGWPAPLEYSATPIDPFQCNPDRDRLSSVSFQGMTDAKKGVHRGARERGGVAADGTGAAEQGAGDRLSLPTQQG
jgi:hypothetical protein